MFFRSVRWAAAPCFDPSFRESVIPKIRKVYGWYHFFRRGFSEGKEMFKKCLTRKHRAGCYIPELAAHRNVRSGERSNGTSGLDVVVERRGFS